MIRQNFCLKRKSKAFELLYSLQTISVKICKNDERDVPDLILLEVQNTSYFILMAHSWNLFISHGHMNNTNFAIIIQMRRDRRNGGHPAYRIIQSLLK